MPRIGEILIAKGVLTQDQLRSGLDAARRNGGRLGTWLVRLGYINEGALLDALSQQYNCPAAKAIDLATAPLAVRNLLPPSFCKRHMVLPFNRSGRQLDVAMVNPADLVVLDEIARTTGLIVRPHVATEAALTAALALASAPAPSPTTTSPSVVPSRAVTREWRQFWKMEAPTLELMKALTVPAPMPAACLAASFPFLTPLSTKAVAAASVEPADLAEALSAATHRDQVATLVLAALAQPGRRVALFSLQQHKVMGWAATGLGVREDFHTFIIPLDRPSVFHALSKGAEMHVGPLPPGDVTSLVTEALGPPPAKEALITPLKVRGKLAGFLWVDSGEEGVARLPLREVEEVARLAGLALEILVLRQKIKAGPRLTEGVATD